MVFAPSISVLTSVYRGENFLPKFLENLRAQTIFPELELILILNEPTSLEKQISKDFQLKMPDQVEILYTKKRETLGSSWNKGWKVARAPYLTMWNVDDRRVIDSLQRQLTAMDVNPDWFLCYGDYMRVSEYGQENGVLRHPPAYKETHFRRSFAQGGAFWLYRKEMHKHIGYFDEQFSVGPDMELSFRLATKGLEMGKCEGLLGYFTDAAQGLSTRDGSQVSRIERTVIQLRYGVFDKVDRVFLKQTKAYRLDAIKQADSWVPINIYVPSIESLIKWQKPLWILGLFRQWFRILAKRLGLLGLIYDAQDRFLKREI
jgi:glycosyltransferase involved in cell wall biosynthesis